MNTHIVFIVLLTISNSIFSQVPHPSNECEDALFKYWTFQEKMENYFMTAAGDINIEGSGIPASRVDICVTNNTTEYKKIWWGDATIDVAWYLASLATQYHLLHEIGERTEDVERKIYEELSTINRLDANAEWFEWPGSFNQGMLEGYILRDDVYAPNNDPQNPTPIYSKNASQYADYDSDGRDVKGNPYNSSSNGWAQPEGSQVSQDHIIHLLMALKCIVDWIPANVNYNNTPFNYDFDNGIPIVNFVHEAQRITDRLVYYFRNRDKWINSQSPKHWMWRLKDNTTNLNVRIGSWGKGLAIGFNDTQEDITNVTPFGLPNFDFKCWAAKKMSKILWRSLRVIPIGQQEDYKPQSLAASSNNWTALRHAWRAWMYNYEHLPLFYSVSYNAPLYFSQNFYWDLIKNDPMYLGACNRSGPLHIPGFFCNGDYGNFEWSSTSRFVHPERRGCGSGFNGNYNNLDYMLLYNLFHIKWDLTMPPYLNGFNAYISSLVNFPFHGYGTSSDPYVVKSIETITAVNTINPNTDVTFRAGESILLTPSTSGNSGFIALPGSNFLAYIKPFIPDPLWIRSCNNLPRLANNSIDPEQGASQDLSTDNISLSPNPFIRDIHIKIMDIEKGKIFIQLFDQLGHFIKTLDKKFLENEVYDNSISLNDLPPGSYLLKVLLENKYILNKKIIKL